MAGRNKRKVQKQFENDNKQLEKVFNGITAGFVIDTHDPQEMGRIKVICTALGDADDTKLEDLPWCSYIAPFAGYTGYGTRGPEETTSKGLIAYGIWGIPKIGAEAIVMCINGDPRYRVWIGCKHTQYTPHTLPNGRFINNDGPLSSSETHIEPTYSNLKEAHNKPNVDEKIRNFERESRITEKQASSLDADRAQDDNNDISVSQIADDDDTGYSLSRLNPNYKNTSSDEEENKDSTIYSITTPGLHSFAMDDKASNCRMKFRTAAGNQILLDDTNERIYISTATGKNWIEMDQQGNVDIFAEGNISMRTKKSLNFTADKDIRFYAKEDIHFRTEREFRIHANSNIHFRTNAEMKSQADLDIHVLTNQNYRQLSLQDTLIESGQEIDVLSTTDMKISSLTTDVHILSNAGNTNITGFASLNLRSTGGNVIVTGTQIHHNGPLAIEADLSPISSVSTNFHAFVPIRIPEHEPWGRISTTEDLTHATGTNENNIIPNILTDLLTELASPVLELTYEDILVNTKDRETIFNRGTHWKR